MNNGIEIFYTEPLFETASIVFWLVLTSMIFVVLTCVMNVAINSFISDMKKGGYARKDQQTALRIFQFVLLMFCLTLLVLLEYRLYTYMRNQTIVHARIHEDASYKYVTEHYDIIEYDATSGICTLQEK